MSHSYYALLEGGYHRKSLLDDLQIQKVSQSLGLAARICPYRHCDGDARLRRSATQSERK
jgi:hypothetical protein